MAAFHDVIKATARLQGDDGVAIQNVYQFRLDQVGGISDGACMDDLADFLDDAYDLIDDLLADSVTFVDIDFFNKTTAQPMGVRPWPTLTVGSSSGEPLPSGVAPLVVLQTGRNRVIGRKFLPQVGSGQVVDGNWGSGFLTALAPFAAFLIGGFLGTTSAAPWLPGVVDKLGVFWSFLTAVVGSEPAYQRRRRAGTGI